MISCPVTGARIESVADHPVLGYGFRPFFALCGLYGALAVPAWVAVWLGYLPLAPALPPSYWHAHEMLYGFAAAALGGFLLTAVPNWTGQGPVRGWPLLVLVLAWLAGRVAMWLSGTLPPAVVAVADIAFLPTLALFQAPAIVVRSARRNAVFLVILAALTVANLGIHFEALGFAATGKWGLLLALDLFVLTVTLVGGRIVPAFTQGGLKAQSIPTAIAPAPRLDLAAILSVAAMAVAEAAHAPSSVVGALALVAAVAALLRLARWQGHKTWRWPLLWVLQLGMAWLVAGLALKSAAAFALVPEAMALHALGAGAIGTMILAVMTRATLGHTGRALIAVAGSGTAYLALSFGTLCRVLAPLLPQWQVALTVAGGALWAVAFVLFLRLYGPMLLFPRPDGRKG
ncbi:MAG: NnrS family protein [Alphaproteobacteria bacterium]|nr:NnrS family protein [Alphaproteobacteria bacterium]